MGSVGCVAKNWESRIILVESLFRNWGQRVLSSVERGSIIKGQIFPLLRFLSEVFPPSDRVASKLKKPSLSVHVQTLVLSSFPSPARCGSVARGKGKPRSSRQFKVGLCGSTYVNGYGWIGCFFFCHRVIRIACVKPGSRQEGSSG